MRSDGVLRLLFGAVVAATLAFALLPSVVVVITAFGEKSLLMFPPDGLSTKWFVRAWTYEDFQSGIQNGLLVTAWASGIALVVGTLAAFAIERFRFRSRTPSRSPVAGRPFSSASRAGSALLPSQIRHP